MGTRCANTMQIVSVGGYSLKMHSHNIFMYNMYNTMYRFTVFLNLQLKTTGGTVSRDTRQKLALEVCTIFIFYYNMHCYTKCNIYSIDLYVFQYHRGCSCDKYLRSKTNF